MQLRLLLDRATKRCSVDMLTSHLAAASSPQPVTAQKALCSESAVPYSVPITADYQLSTFCEQHRRLSQQTVSYAQWLKCRVYLQSAITDLTVKAAG